MRSEAITSVVRRVLNPALPETARDRGNIPAGALRKSLDYILERRGCSRRDLKLNSQGCGE